MTFTDVVLDGVTGSIRETAVPIGEPTSA